MPSPEIRFVVQNEVILLGFLRSIDSTQEQSHRLFWAVHTVCSSKQSRTLLTLERCPYGFVHGLTDPEK